MSGPRTGRRAVKTHGSAAAPATGADAGSSSAELFQKRTMIYCRRGDGTGTPAMTFRRATTPEWRDGREGGGLPAVGEIQRLPERTWRSEPMRTRAEAPASTLRIAPHVLGPHSRRRAGESEPGLKACPRDPISGSAVSPEEVDAFLPVLERACRFVTSALWRWADAPPLDEQLERLRVALSARDARAASNAIARAEQMLARCRRRQAGPGEAADLKVIVLVLDRAETLLGVEPAWVRAWNTGAPQSIRGPCQVGSPASAPDSHDPHGGGT